MTVDTRDGARGGQAEASGRREHGRVVVGSARTGIGTMLGVFAFALIVRLIYLYESAAGPTFEAPISDAQNYDLLVRSVLDQKALSARFFWQPFFYPSFLTLVYSLSHSSIVVAKVLQVLLGSVTCVLTYLLGKRVFDRRIGLVAAVITGLYGPLIYYEAELLATGWATFWSVALILLFLKVASGKNLGLCFVLGACGALAVLTRPTFLPFFFAGCVWLGITFRRGAASRRLPVLALITIAVGFCVIATPPAVVNLRVTGHFGIMPANGGVNLYMGNNPDAAETEATRPWLEYERLRNLAVEEGATDQWSEHRLFQRKVIHYALTQPIDFTAGLVRKTVQFITSREIPSYEDVYLFRRWSHLLGLLTWKTGRFGFPFGVLLPLVIVGLMYHWRRISVPVALWLVLYPLSVILVHVTGRYRIPLVPTMAIIAAAGALTFYETVRLRRWGRLAVAGCVAVVVGFLCSRPGPFRMETLNFEADMHFSLGEYNRKLRGRTDEAIRLYREALLLNPNSAEAHTCLAHALLGQGRSTEALSHYNEVLHVEPDFPGAHNNLVVALVKAGKTDEAITHCNEWIRADPGLATAHSTLALVLSSVGRVDEAVHYYREAVRLKPRDADTRYSLAGALRDRGKIEEAVEQYRESLRLDPKHADGHSDLGIALSRLGQVGEAVRAYREALRIDPGHFGAHYNMGNVLAKQGRLDDAVREYRLALWTNPSYANAHYNLGLALHELGRLDEAADSLREVLRLNPDHPRASRELAVIMAKQNR